MVNQDLIDKASAVGDEYGKLGDSMGKASEAMADFGKVAFKQFPWYMRAWFWFLGMWGPLAKHTICRLKLHIWMPMVYTDLAEGPGGMEAHLCNGRRCVACGKTKPKGAHPLYMSSRGTAQAVQRVPLVTRLVSYGYLTHERAKRFLDFITSESMLKAKYKVLYFFPWYVRVWHRLTRLASPLFRWTACRLNLHVRVPMLYDGREGPESHASENLLKGKRCLFCSRTWPPVRDRQFDVRPNNWKV